MKRTPTGFTLAFLVWILTFGIISACILPIFMAIGRVTSASDLAINITGKFICPDVTTPESYSYVTSTQVDNGNSKAVTIYELHCVADNGEILMSDPVGYASMWIGAFSVIGLLVSSGLAFLLVSPICGLITKWMNRNKRTDKAET